MSNEIPDVDLKDLLEQKAKSGELIVCMLPKNVSGETLIAIEKMTDNLKGLGAKVTTVDPKS